MLNILLIPISFLTGAAYFIEEWYAGANRKHIPVSSKTVSACSAVRASSAPSLSSTSAAPLLLDTLRFPCFATRMPPAAATNALVVEILKVPTSSPPVPTMSITGKGGDSFTALSRITVAQAVISSMVSPFILRAVRNEDICAWVAFPLMISSITSLVVSKSRFLFSTNS